MSDTPINPRHLSDTSKCPYCLGDGISHDLTDCPVDVPCDHCGGVGEVQVCATCEGNGWVVGVEERVAPSCCGHFTRYGECCGEPVPVSQPEQVQLDCPDCYRGTRALDDKDRS